MNQQQMARKFQAALALDLNQIPNYFSFFELTFHELFATCINSFSLLKSFRIDEIQILQLPSS